MSPVVVQPLWFFPFPSFPALPRLRALQGSENVPGSFPAVTTHGKGVWTAPNPLRCCPRAFAKPGQPCLAAARAFGVFPTFRVFANCFELLLPPGKLLFSLYVKSEAVLRGPRELRGAQGCQSPVPAHASAPRTRQHRGPRGPHPSAPRPNSSLPSERNSPLLQRAAGLREGGRICEWDGSAWF